MYSQLGVGIKRGMLSYVVFSILKHWKLSQSHFGLSNNTATLSTAGGLSNAE
jgi:hypothetical protein